MESASTIASHVIQLLEKSETKRLAGSQLRTLLNFEFPGFKPEIYGCGNLRQFITKNVSLVGELGRAGADVVYGLKPQEQTNVAPAANVNAPTTATEIQAPAETPAREVTSEAQVFLDPSVWKTFASPRAPYKLFGNPQTGDLRVVPPGEATPTSPWLRIPPCPEASHLQIAKDFISTLPEESHRRWLADELDKPRWWDAYFLKAQQLDLLTAWGAFRRQRLTREFESTLKNLGIPFVQYRESLPHRQLAARPFRAGLQAAPTNSETSKLRRLAVGAVQQMSTTELRALMLPLGYIADGLNES
jgi:hypothetical protein